MEFLGVILGFWIGAIVVLALGVVLGNLVPNSIKAQEVAEQFCRLQNRSLENFKVEEHSYNFTWINCDGLLAPKPIENHTFNFGGLPNV